MSYAPVAVLDANVLFPFQLRNLLLHLAAERRFEPLWSDEIVSEFLRALRRDAGLSETQCSHLHSQMRTHFPLAWGRGHAGAVDGLPLPDEGDRHVVALAVHFEAEYIVTRNLRHFPDDVLHPLGIEPIDPETFIEVLYLVDPSAVLHAAELHRRSLRVHPLSGQEYLDSLRIHARLPHVADLLRSAGLLDLSPSPPES